MLLRCERREYDIAVEDRMSVKQAEDKVKQLGALRDTFDATSKVGTAASNAQSHALDAEVQVCVRLTAAGQRFQLTGGGLAEDLQVSRLREQARLLDVVVLGIKSVGKRRGDIDAASLAAALKALTVRRTIHWERLC